VPEYARSALYVGRYHVLMDGGELNTARDYLESVASSNSEEVGQAADLLKKTLQMIASQGDMPMKGAGTHDSGSMAVGA
jgi:anaphase-promoting complex subunit 8